MNLLLVHKEELINSQAIITGDKLKHLRRILKVKAGDKIKAGIIGEKIGHGIITSISKEQALVQICTKQSPPERLPVHLVLAIPRPIMLKRVLAQAASLGVEKITLLRSRRVEKSFLDSSIIAEKNFSPFLLKGIEQSVDTIMPEIALHRRFKPFIERASTQEANHLKLIGHPQGTVCLKEHMGKDPKKRVTVAIGPEGGWIDYEVERFAEIGFIPFSMGERILRVDTAVPAILSQLNMLCP